MCHPELVSGSPCPSRESGNPGNDGVDSGSESGMTKWIASLRLKRREWQKGVTLIELILYMGIFSSLLMVLVQLFGTIVNVNLEAQSTSAVAQDGRFILTRFAYDMRRASSITLPAVGTPGSTLTLVINGANYTYALTSNGSGAYNLALDDGSGAQQLNSAGTTVAANGNLFTQLKSSNTTGTVDDTVTMSFTLTSTVTRAGRGTEQKSFQTTVGTR